MCTPPLLSHYSLLAYDLLRAREGLYNCRHEFPKGTGNTELNRDHIQAHFQILGETYPIKNWAVSLTFSCQHLIIWDLFIFLRTAVSMHCMSTLTLIKSCCLYNFDWFEQLNTSTVQLKSAELSWSSYSVGESVELTDSLHKALAALKLHVNLWKKAHKNEGLCRAQKWWGLQH